MTYTALVKQYIKEKKIGEPIYVDSLGNLLSEHFILEKGKAKAAASTAIKRIMDGNLIDNLRFYRKGIYYLCIATPFGETGINTNQLIYDKYINGDKGYESGFGFLNKIGLSTQMAYHTLISTNEANVCRREDRKLGVKTVPPKTEITGKNKYYLQLLDALELIDKAPIDVDNPYGMLADYITEMKLDYGVLLGFANKYYSRNTLVQLARTAEAGGEF